MLNLLHHKSLGLLIAAATIAHSFAPQARATTVAPMSIPTISDYAGQVVMGTVAAVRSYRAGGTGTIESEVTFSGVTYLKGAPARPSDTFTLTVPGGAVGESVLRIGCAPTFKVGEEWILFVLPTYKTFPVVGISNGAFRVEADPSGTQRVYSTSRTPVIEIDGRVFVQTRRARSGSNSGTGLAGGDARVRVLPVQQRAATAMALDDFLAMLKPILLRSKGYSLNGPAGRRLPVTYTPVSPVRSIGASRSANGNGTDRPRDHGLRAPLTTRTRTRPARVGGD